MVWGMGFIPERLVMVMMMMMIPVTGICGTIYSYIYGGGVFLNAY